MWPPQSVNTWPTPAPLSVRATSSPPVIQSEGAGPLRTSPAVIASASEIYRLASPAPAARTAAPPRPAARTTTSTHSPRPPGPHPPTGPPPPPPPTTNPPPPAGPATACGSHDHIHRLASAGGAPAPQRPAARTATHQNFSHLTDLRSRPLATRTSRTRWIIDSLPQT